MNEMNRRDFLKTSGKVGAVAAGMAALSGCTVDLQQPVRMEMYAQAPEQTLPGEDFWFASTCRMCPAGCGIVTRVSNGRARKIEGNPEHPLNRGALCARGQAGLQQLYHPDRLQKILVSTGARGAGQWATTDWEQILDELANTIQSTDAERIAFLSSLGAQGHAELVGRFLKGLGAPPAVIYDNQSTFDGRVVLRAANEALFGEPSLPVFDIGTTDVVFGFGADFLETWLSPVAYGRAYGDLRSRILGRGAFVAFAPRLSMTAASADSWQPVAPGTEGLVALALGKIIVDEGLGHDVSHTEHKVLYEHVDVTAVAQASGVAVDRLAQLAHIFADVHHAIAVPGGLLTGYTNGLDAVKAVEALNVVMGDPAAHGRMFLSPPALSRDLRQPAANSLQDVQDLIQRMNAGDIDLLFVLDANPLYELPAALGFGDALAHVQKVVAFATLPTETTAQADIILPAHTYLETWGYQFVQPSWKKAIVSAQQPVVQPLYDTRDPSDIIMALADKIGGSAASRLPWPNMVNFIQTRLTSLQLVDGNISTQDADTFWSDWLQHGGFWSQEATWIDPQPGEGLTAALDVAAPVFEGDASTYPLHLIPVPSVSFGDGRHAGLPWLQEMPDPMTTAMWETWVEINPTTAAELDVITNDVVKITSPAGEIEAVVYVYPGIRPDVVAVPVGQGHTAQGRWAQDRGTNVLQILAPITAQDSGQWAWAATQVKVTKVGSLRQLPLMESNLGVDRARQRGESPL